MAIDFSDKILITRPNAYFLGRMVIGFGLLLIAVGGVTFFTDTFWLPYTGWFAIALPTIAIGVILVASSITKA